MIVKRVRTTYIEWIASDEVGAGEVLLLGVLDLTLCRAWHREN